MTPCSSRHVVHCALHLASSLVLLISFAALLLLFFFFFFNDTATTEIYTLSLHDALPISSLDCAQVANRSRVTSAAPSRPLFTDSLLSVLGDGPSSRAQTPGPTRLGGWCMGGASGRGAASPTAWGLAPRRGVAGAPQLVVAHAARGRLEVCLLNRAWWPSRSNAATASRTARRSRRCSSGTIVRHSRRSSTAPTPTPCRRARGAGSPAMGGEPWSATWQPSPACSATRPEWRVPRCWSTTCSDRKSTRLNSSHGYNSYAVFFL